MTWVEQKTNIYKEWTEGEVLEGIFVGEEDKCFKIDDGQKVHLVKKTSMLVAGLAEVRIGQKVKITFIESKKTKNDFDLMVFKVEKWVEKY
jgi:hypothetical protein